VLRAPPVAGKAGCSVTGGAPMGCES
jgi:hypothetical protein